jgi:hypothetical protein
LWHILVIAFDFRPIGLGEIAAYAPKDAYHLGAGMLAV